MNARKKRSKMKLLKYVLFHLTPNTRSKLVVKAYRNLISPTDKLLDVGCGSGRITAALMKNTQANFVGCDILDYTTHDIPFKLMKKPDTLPFLDNTFNISLITDVLHHLDYATQEKIIREALRVSPVILMFETRPTKLGRLCDYLLSQCYIPPLKALFTFRDDNQWKELFRKMGMEYKIIKIQKPIFYPFENMAFQLRLNKAR